MRMLAGMQNQQAAEKKPLVSFKCGQMNHESIRGQSSKLRLAADQRKGLLQVVKEGDGMIHVQWRDRATGQMGFDRPVFPDDITFKRIRTGKDTDRVYEFKYKANETRFFFWMQVGVFRVILFCLRARRLCFPRERHSTAVWACSAILFGVEAVACKVSWFSRRELTNSVMRTSKYCCVAGTEGRGR